MECNSVIDALGERIDHACDAGDMDDLQRCIADAEVVASNITDDVAISTTHYYIANAYSGLHSERKSSNIPDIEHNHYLEKEIWHLRKAAAISSVGGVALFKSDLPCRIATNLGNALNHIGRFSEAIECWDTARDEINDFAMAQGNKGYGLFYYARLLPEETQQVAFLFEARRNLRLACQGNLESGAAIPFEKTIEWISAIIPEDIGLKLDGYPLGEDLPEQKYRQWSLKSRLFLNPLNDIFQASISAYDGLMLPPITAGISEKPKLHGLFNQIKQEYASARYMIYEGLESNSWETHFSDKDVLLYDLLDYGKYSVSIEKLKMSYMMLFSIFDKIAYLLNVHYELNIPVGKTSFRKLWSKDFSYTTTILTTRSGELNWPMRGLHWVSKDLYSSDMQNVIEPQAKELQAIRNHIAHKYLKVHDELWQGLGSLDLFNDGMAHSITRNDLEAKCIKLIKLVRAAIIYAVSGIYIYEKERSMERDGLVAPMVLNTIDDRWKT